MIDATEFTGSDDSLEQCRVALENVHAFLHGELPEATADELRAHLMVCEECMENFNIEELISSLVRRSCAATVAPDHLRVRVHSMRVTYTHEQSA